MVKYYKVLTIAGSDSSGGAGIQADLKTFAALGCYGMSVITALTAQNTRGVTAIHAVPLDFIEAQVKAVFSDIKPDAVKTGMLLSADIIELVAGLLKKYNPPNIVIDPVMIAQSGDRLIDDNAVEATKTLLLPIADMVTPNIPEAAALLNKRIQSIDDIKPAASELSGFGCKNVLIKGGHADDTDCTDVFFTAVQKQYTYFSEKRITTKNNHGTGCTLASAIASFLAKGETMENSVKHAKQYITGAIKAGAPYAIGKGHGPVHHFYRFW
ncbi:MAG: bifunctional hydroxymethylpyrimidine kinase/phosphomethylpyrimidine kinase [Deltaproteobacteria bacterium]|nr:bifunctional hydroxymethylpyrimidine kinase/phosphomethylpyrimidine kinase [Deltaproteobacteria bacterium]MBW2219189.1 bifunctional hydroxymethylpyrimidine kinase/phosphomethylpyrimidine kinase [Deltaproteobacteria bacterium]